MARPRLRKGDISIYELLELTQALFRSGKVDDKEYRSKLDVISAKLRYRNNLTYDRSLKKWVQTGREVRLDFNVRSDPISYKKNDTVKIHQFPVSFLVREWDKGIDSAFRYRSGSLYRWESAKKKVREGRNEQEKDRIRKENLAITNRNIKRGIDAHFVFHLMFVLDAYDLLFGPNTALRRAPNKTNPDLLPYFEKHSWKCLTEYIIPFMEKNKRL